MEEQEKMKKYKDKCDQCGKFDVLKGYNGKCLCVQCRNQNSTKNIKQMSIFDREVNDGKRI